MGKSAAVFSLLLSDGRGRQCQLYTLFRGDKFRSHGGNGRRFAPSRGLAFWQRQGTIRKTRFFLGLIKTAAKSVRAKPFWRAFFSEKCLRLFFFDSTFICPCQNASVTLRLNRVVLD